MLRPTMARMRWMRRLLRAVAARDAGVAPDLAEALGIDPESTVSEVVAAVGEADGSKLAVLATQLRELVERTKREHSVVRAAADSLARHMAGIVQSVTGALSGTGVYGRQGRLRDGSSLAAGLDLTT